MDSFFWQVLSYITLSLGLLLLAAAAVLAVRYKIFSLILSESRTKGVSEMDMAPETPITLDMTDMPVTVHPAVERKEVPAEEGDNVTMVVARKKRDTGDMTVVVSRKPVPDKGEGFRITRNILLINADPDVVDK